MPHYNRKTPIKSDCPMEKTLNVISGKWKPAILSQLFRSKVRLKDLLDKNPDASKRAITKQLKELVEDGILLRKDFDEYPKKVEYSLTPLGKKLLPVIKSLNKFGEYLN